MANQYTNKPSDKNKYIANKVMENLNSKVKASAKTYRDHKVRVIRAIKKKFSGEALDSQVHQLKSQEASEINNRGIDAQLDYLITEAGLDYVEDYYLRKPDSNNE